jgi:hypothetical protein
MRRTKRGTALRDIVALPSDAMRLVQEVLAVAQGQLALSLFVEFGPEPLRAAALRIRRRSRCTAGTVSRRRRRCRRGSRSWEPKPDAGQIAMAHGGGPADARYCSPIGPENAASAPLACTLFVP